MVCLQSRYPRRFSRLYIKYPQVLELNLFQYFPGENAAQFSAARAIHTVPIFVPPGIHYCWVDRGGADSKLAQGFYTRLGLRESNPRCLDLKANASIMREHRLSDYIMDRGKYQYSQTINISSTNKQSPLRVMLEKCTENSVITIQWGQMKGYKYIHTIDISCTDKQPSLKGQSAPAPHH